MILIITKDSDRAVERIIDSLLHLKASYYKGSLEDVMLNCKISIKQSNGKLDLYINDVKVNCIFFRQHAHLEITLKQLLKNSDLRHFLAREVNIILGSFSDFFSFTAFPYFNKINNNKVTDLCHAQSVGINIPPYIITNQKTELVAFKNQHKNIICKALSNGIRVTFRDSSLFTYVGIITKQIMDKISDRFFISFFQAYIEKEYELRIFFIDDQFFPMAIMSQESEKTTIDFRRYNTEKWNRNIPYELPNELESKLKSLMQKMNLSTGSIDIVKSTEGKYYFLEVNPIGQFDMTSAPCNYDLDLVIAQTLIKYDKTRN